MMDKLGINSWFSYHYIPRIVPQTLSKLLRQLSLRAWDSPWESTSGPAVYTIRVPLGFDPTSVNLLVRFT